MEYTDKALAELISKLTVLIEGAEGHLPEIANQMLIYGAFDANLTLIIGVIFAIPTIILFILAVIDGDAPGYSIFSVVFFILSLIFCGCGVSTLYKIDKAPKLYLLQQTADLVKAGK